MQHLVYLHGFLSSKRSEKAQHTLSFAKKYYPSLNVHIPELSGDIFKTKRAIDSLMRTLNREQVGFIGSSMGGFLSTYCLEQYCFKTTLDTKAKAVLVNPAVTPVELLEHYMGKHINPYTQEVFYIHQHHLHCLSEMHQHILKRPEKYMVLLQTGDETLDYKLAEDKYSRSNLLIEQGGNHSFINYESYLPKIFQFLYS